MKKKGYLVRFKFIVSGSDATGILRHNIHNINPNFYNCEYDNDTPGRGDRAYRH